METMHVFQSRRFAQHLARRAQSALLVVATVLATGCGETDETTAPVVDGPTFVVQVNGETFKVRSSNAAMQATLRNHLNSGRTGVLHGRLVTGSGGFNAPHLWHLDPSSITTPDVAIEVCDGRPSDIDGDLPYWMANVKFYCPWGATVIREDP